MSSLNIFYIYIYIYVYIYIYIYIYIFIYVPFWMPFNAILYLILPPPLLTICHFIMLLFQYHFLARLFRCPPCLQHLLWNSTFSYGACFSIRHF